MKRNRFVLLSLLSLLIVGCNNETSNSNSIENTDSSNSNSFESTDSSNISIEENSSSTENDFQPVTLDEYKSFIKIDLDDYVRTMNFESLDEVTLSKINNHVEICKNEIDLANDFTEVKEAFENVKGKIANEIPLANGMFSIENSLQAIGQLEAYAERNSLTGLTLYEEGSYEVYSDRVTLPTNTYITNYGFGLLEEGSIDEDIEFQPNSAWKRYLHLAEKKENLLISESIGKGYGSKYFNYLTAPYFSCFLNDEKNGIQTYGVLANSGLIPVNVDENGRASIYKMEVKTGKDGLKYTTNSTLESRMPFNNRPVELEDYLTMYKAYLTQSNNLYSSPGLSEYVNAFVGAEEYYKESKDGPADFDKVGIKVYSEGGKDYIQFELVIPFTIDSAIDFINNNVFQPVPQEFLDIIGVNNYFSSDLDNGIKLMDNILSLGPYCIEQCCDDTKLVFKKNPNYVYANEKYKIEGIHIDYSDYTSTILERFEAGYVDYAPLGFDEFEKFENYKNFVINIGYGNFGLNINATDEKTWEKLFGENGKAFTNPKSDYWEVEPALSNDHFLKALSLSMNRKEFATINNEVPSCSYFNGTQMFNFITYNSTREHQIAIQSKIENTDGYGYNLDLAREYFKVALQELENEGKYKPGSKENPTIIELEIAWTSQSSIETYHKDIKEYLETAFNHESVSNGQYKLEITSWIGEQWSDIYYQKSLAGKFDISFGKISSSSYNPYTSLKIMSSDPSISDGFTTLWSVDTNDINEDYVIYDGKRFTYDSLIKALENVSFVESGINTSPATIELINQTKNADKSYTSTFKVDFIDGFDVNINDIVLCWYSANYMEKSINEQVSYEIDHKINTYTFTVNTPYSDVKYYYHNMGFDVYYKIGNDDSVYESFVSCYGYFE